MTEERNSKLYEIETPSTVIVGSSTIMTEDDIHLEYDTISAFPGIYNNRDEGF
jgi:hypothetical protein